MFVRNRKRERGAFNRFLGGGLKGRQRFWIRLNKRVKEIEMESKCGAVICVLKSEKKCEIEKRERENKI
jgi:hypothetical protein